jgi:hypothetical protein
VSCSAESAARADWAVAARAASVMAALAKAVPVPDAECFCSLQPFAVTLVNSDLSADKIDIFLVSE